MWAKLRVKNAKAFSGRRKKRKKKMEMPGIEPGASHMRSERSTTELHPQVLVVGGATAVVTQNLSLTQMSLPVIRCVSPLLWACRCLLW